MRLEVRMQIISIIHTVLSPIINPMISDEAFIRIYILIITIYMSLSRCLVTQNARRPGLSLYPKGTSSYRVASMMGRDRDKFS